jgi:hypothetical protein
MKNLDPGQKLHACFMEHFYYYFYYFYYLLLCMMSAWHMPASRCLCRAGVELPDCGHRTRGR